MDKKKLSLKVKNSNIQNYKKFRKSLGNTAAIILVQESK